MTTKDVSLLHFFAILAFIMLPSNSNAQSALETHNYIEDKCNMLKRNGYEYRLASLFMDARLDFGPDIRPGEPSIAKIEASHGFYSNGFRNLDFWTYSAPTQELELSWAPNDGGLQGIRLECIDGTKCVDVDITKQDGSKSSLSSRRFSIYCRDANRVGNALRHLFENYVEGRNQDPFQ